MIIKWLDSQPIAREQGRSVARVPNCERKHAIQVVDATGSVILVEMSQALGIPLGRQAMTAPQELTSQRLKIVELAIDDGLDRVIFIGDRLPTASHVHDRQAAM